MIPIWQLVTISVLYIASLFAVAWYGDRRAQKGRPIHASGAVYSLSLAVYCTSWTFYGAVGQAATTGWEFLAIYIGPIVFLLVFWQLLRQVIRISKEKRITSIADFIATRYGKDHSLAVLVTLVAILCVVPYIALQLKAISATFELLTLPLGHTLYGVEYFWQDTAFYISLAMAVFVIIFGTRDIDASEQHPGMILAIAFESIIKLVAFAAVGIWVMSSLFETPFEVFELTQEVLPDHPLLQNDLLTVSFFTQCMLAGLAILCLPRQFQVGVIENEDHQHVKTARWLFPGYLLLMMIFVVPIALTGQLFIQEVGFEPDTYVLSLPVVLGQSELAVLAFLGGGSAATGMIIVATIAVSTMVSNELVLPVFFRQQTETSTEMQRSNMVRTLVLSVRRMVILGMLLGSYIFYRLIGEFDSLASIGMLSFAAAAQMAPLLIGGLIWNAANRQGAIAGLIAGTSVWFYGLMWPFIAQSGQPSGIGLIEYMPGLSVDEFSAGVLFSLAANVFFYVLFSFLTNSSVRERMLAGDFTSAMQHDTSEVAPAFDCKVDDVRAVLERILGFRKTDEFFTSYQSQHGIQYNHAAASSPLLQESEKLLGSVVGSSSARVIFSALLGGERVQFRDLAFIASEASQAFSMSRDQLRAALENLQQGVSVVDKDLKVVAWNHRYLEIFNYPSGFIYMGKPIEEMIRYNVQRGFCGDGEIEEQISRRMQFLRDSSAHQFERVLPNGTVIYMQGYPMPDGGFVTSFTDITAHRKAEQTLREANVSLERRVEKSSQQLEDLTHELIEANFSKSRFLAATGHDLMQPLNAAKLFASTLSQKPLGDDERGLLEHLEGALQSAEDMLAVLVEIAKLDSGSMAPSLRPVELSQVLKPLRDEFTALAAEKGLKLHV
ncbi:MAG: sodium:solute symporter family transporter, partial [Oceanobacter sp.]